MVSRVRIAALVALVASLVIIGLAMAAGDPGAGDCINCQAPSAGQPVMHPDQGTLEKWMKSYEAAPAVPQERNVAAQGPGPAQSRDLLPLINYNPQDRDQGGCGNCWVWAGTGIMEIAHNVENGIDERLSTQFFNSNWNGGGSSGDYACCGGWLNEFADFYDAQNIAIPWTNTGAGWQDWSTGCGGGLTSVPAGSITTTPRYSVGTINEQRITTLGVGTAQAIQNIKDVLDDNRGVWFSFFGPDTASANNFISTFWGAGLSTDLYDFDQWDGRTYDSPVNQGWGHAVLIVGYDDTAVNPDDDYWIVLNSWGTTANRPDGTFRMRMNLNYDASMTNFGPDSGHYLQFMTLDVDFPNTAPTVSAGGPYVTNEGSPITVTATATDAEQNPLLYQWDLDNDGSWDTTPSSFPTATWLYVDEYVGTVRVKVSDGELETVATASMTVNNVNPVIAPIPPQVVNEGDTVTLTASATDAGVNDVLFYAWDINNDGLYEIGTPLASTTYLWCDNGVYTVNLLVTDGDGGSATATTTVTVNNVAPVANAGPDQTVDEGDTVTFTGSATDPGCDTFTYEWDFDGNGVYDATGQTVTFNWCDNGVHTVTLRVTDDDGGIGTDTLTVTVNNVAPVANAGPDQTVDEGAIVTFTGSATDPGCDTFTYEWDFDGNGVYDATGQTVTHSWCDDGVHIVTLRVTDDDGGIGTDTLTVTVNNVAPAVAPITLVQPNPQFILPKVHRLTFQGTFADPGCDTWTYEWTFGDGTPAVTGSLAAIAPLSTRHIFAVPGDYTVTLTVRDDDGGQDTETFLVHVTDEYGALHDLKAYVQDLPSGAFSGNAASLKAMLSSQFNALEVKLQHKDYPGFIRDITSIRAKADGEKIGRVRDDWIIDKTAQQHVCMKIDDLVAYIKTRM